MNVFAQAPSRVCFQNRQTINVCDERDRFLEWVQFKSLNEDQLEGHASVYFAVDVYRDSKRAVSAASSSAAAAADIDN